MDWLLAAIGGLRILAVVLGTAILMWWGSSVKRVLLGRPRDRDDVRAIWSMLAGAVLLFQVRWLWPGLDEVSRNQIWAIAHLAMVMTLACAIYSEGVEDGRLKLRRAIAVHLAMLVLAIVAVAAVR